MGLYREKPLKGKRIVVIGAGMAGLSAAIALAAAGARVRVLEKSDRAGGRQQQLKSGDFTFDLATEFVTSTQVLGRLFSCADHRISDFVQFKPIDPMARLIYPDGQHLDISRDIEKLKTEIAKFSELDAKKLDKQWQRFEALALDADDYFFAVPSSGRWNWRELATSASGWRVAGAAISFSRLSTYLKRKFEGPGMPEVYEYFMHRLGTTSYSCGKMLRALGTLELSRGAWIPEGGMDALVTALVRLARELGVKIHTNCRVERLETEQRRIKKVCGDGFKDIGVDAVISTVNPRTCLEKMFKPTKTRMEEFRRLKRKKLSPSQLTFFWGLRREIPELESLQTVLLSNNQKETDRALRKWRVMPASPHISITNMSKATPSFAPEGKQALRVSMLAPYVTDRYRWTDDMIRRERENVMRRLEELDIVVMPSDIEEEMILTPPDWEELTGSEAGALFGVAYTGLRSWAYRPANVSRSVRGLYFAGCWTHPGPTLPLSMTSAMMAVQLVIRHNSSTDA